MQEVMKKANNNALQREYSKTNQTQSKGTQQKGKTQQTKMTKDYSRNKNDSRYKQTQNQENKQFYVLHEGVLATPKELISQEYMNKGKNYIDNKEIQLEKAKNSKSQFKGSTSIQDSSQKSMIQSQEKSSGSDQKLSSSQMKDKSESASKLSETENSEEEQKVQ